MWNNFHLFYIIHFILFCFVLLSFIFVQTLPSIPSSEFKETVHPENENSPTLSHRKTFFIICRFCMNLHNVNYGVSQYTDVDNNHETNNTHISMIIL